LSGGRPLLPVRSRLYALVMAIESADLEPTVIIIEDEFSTMSDDEYDVALVAWLAEIDAADAVVVPVSAADTLRDIREHGES
jgi:hypothetical protein